MDFNKFDSRKAADEGRPLHLKHPSTGELLYDNEDDPFADNGKPCVVYVLGAEGRSVQKQLKEVVSEIAADRESEEDEKAKAEKVGYAEFQQSRLVQLTAPLIAGFENIKRGKRNAKSPDDVEWFLNLQLVTDNDAGTSFAEQISGFATKRGNYLGN